MLVDVKDKSIDEQGERMVPAFHKGAIVYGEHLTRYESISGIVKNKTVLDIASGSGYGSYILAGSAQKVIGVDVDPGSIAYAKKNYAKKNIEFILGSAEKIPLQDNSIDVVVTFETIEHIKNHKKFLNEIKRVLKKGGVAIISTPNDHEFPEGNHFHLHEFEQKELNELLNDYFKYVEFTYQYTWIIAALMSDKKANTEWTENIKTSNYAPVSNSKALYFMVICSDNNIDKLKVDELAAISQHWSAKRLQEEQTLIESEKKDLRGAIKHLEGVNTKLVKDKRSVKHDLEQIINSKGWKILCKFYAVKARFKWTSKSKNIS